MFTRSLLAALSVAFMACGGCRTPHALPAVAATEGDRIRVNCYSILYQLLSQQKNVDKLLLVKLERPQLHRLIKAVAAASDEGATQLEAFAAQDNTVALNDSLLPAGEVATREAIARTKTKELLVPFNPNFELNLLITQAEALSYAHHLAEVASTHETTAVRAKYLSHLGDEMKKLHRQTHALLRSRMAPTKPGEG